MAGSDVTPHPACTTTTAARLLSFLLSITQVLTPCSRLKLPSPAHLIMHILCYCT